MDSSKLLYDIREMIRLSLILKKIFNSLNFCVIKNLRIHREFFNLIFL